MAYVEPWDPTTPSDVEGVSQGDDRIRELKRAIEERMETLVEDWDEDPLSLRESVFPGILAEVGILADRPADPEGTGSLYFAYDTDQLFYGSVDDPPEWIEFRPVADVPLGPPANFNVEDTSICDGGTGEFSAGLTWTVTDTEADTIIYRDGEEIIRLTPRIDEFADDDIDSAGSYTYEIRHALDDELSTPATRILKVGDPCAAEPDVPTATGLKVEETGSCADIESSDPADSHNEATLTWNEEAGFETRVYRSEDGAAFALVTTLADGVTQYVDGAITTYNTYEYYIVHYDGTDEGNESTHAVYLAVNQCDQTLEETV